MVFYLFFYIIILVIIFAYVTITQRKWGDFRLVATTFIASVLVLFILFFVGDLFYKDQGISYILKFGLSSIVIFFYAFISYVFMFLYGIIKNWRKDNSHP